MAGRDQKRFYRELKRQIKKIGNKQRRRTLKKALEEHPAEAHWDEFAFGRDSTKWLNGVDKDRTRQDRSDERS